MENGFHCEDCELQDITLDSMKKMLETLDFSLVDVTKRRLSIHYPIQMLNP